MKKNQKTILWVGIGLASLGLASYVAYTIVKKRKPQAPKLEKKESNDIIVGKDTYIKK